jgi:hypothetical protein
MIALLLIGLATPASAGFGEPAIGPDPKNDDWCKGWCDTWGELRFIGSLPPDVVLDTDGTELGQDFHLDSRLRAGFYVGRPKLHAVFEGDLFEGQVAGDTWDIPGEEDARDRHRMGAGTSEDFDLRKAYLRGVAGPVRMQAGVATSHWGLGMLANDGNRDPMFGRNDFGDRVLRVQLASRPFGQGKTPLVIALAGDRVIEDELARWRPFAEEGEQGEAAWQGIASVSWMPKDKPNYGLYGVWRSQTEADDLRTTRIGIIDGYADGTIELDGLSLRLAGEAATIFGNTDVLTNYNYKDRLKVRMGGMTGLVEAMPDDFWLGGILRAGWASGDTSQDDETMHDFVFDRDFDAGMVMHDEYKGAIDASAYDQIGRPEHTGGRPVGVDGLVREGAVAHSSFLQPVAQAQPLDWVKIRAGATFHWATGPVAHPFTTTRNGGVPANHLGDQTEGYWLGTELNWALEVGEVVVGPEAVGLKPALLLQGGHLLGGDNLSGERVSLVTATGRVRW